MGTGVEVGEANTDVFPLMIIAEPVAGKEKAVPDTTSEPPGASVCPGPNTKVIDEPYKLAVIVWTPNLKMGMFVGLNPSGDVFPFTTTAEPPAAGRLKVVPEIVRAPPGVNVWPGARTKAIDDPDILAAMACPPMVSTDGTVGLAARLCVWPLIKPISPPKAILIVVPPKVTAGPPADAVTPGATTNLLEGFAVMVLPPNVRVGGAGAEGKLLTAIVLPPTIRFPPSLGTEMTCPLIVAICPA